MRKKTTIKDVAQRTGLSVGTISKYINGQTVKEENRERIAEAMEALSYVPDKRARGLRTDRSYMVGIVWDLPGNPGESLLVQEIEEVLRSRGYTVLIAFHRRDADRYGDILLSMEKKRVDGLVIKPLEKRQALLRKLKQRGISIVEMAAAYPFGLTDRVVTDVSHGIYQSGEYLIQRGHKRIALLGLGESPLREERLRGYGRVLEDYEIDFFPSYVPDTGSGFADGYVGMEALWRMEKPPSGLILASYHIGLGAISYLQKERVRIPGDLSLIVCEDSDYSLLSRPKLSALSSPMTALAGEATELLLRRMGGDWKHFPRNRRIAPDLIPRESVGERLELGSY